MVTVAKKFGPLVECCSTWLLEDVVFLKETQSAHISGGVVWGTPVPDVPGDGVRDQCIFVFGEYFSVESAYAY